MPVRKSVALTRLTGRRDAITVLLSRLMNVTVALRMSPAVASVAGSVGTAEMS